MPWEFWIDVGGTFTDCVARSPDEQLVVFKLLSSGVTKGRIESGGRDTFADPARNSDPDNFWAGYAIRFLDPHGNVLARANVAASERGSATLRLDEPLPELIQPGTIYELVSDEEAPIVAIRRILGLGRDEPIPEVSVKLGTTRGTNALLTRTGARTAFVTTKGFADVLLIGNQARPRLFDLAIKKPSPLFERVVEIDERIDASGNVLAPPAQVQIRGQFDEMKTAGIEAVAICLLHSFANPAHELLVERIAREAGFDDVSTSSRLSPLIKIVSRGQTTAMDAYLNPVLRNYVARLRQSLGGRVAGAGRSAAKEAPVQALPRSHFLMDSPTRN